jgi:hypothetical protein
MEKSVLKGEACPNLVNAFVNAFDADPWRFPDVATMVVVTKTPQAHVYQLVSAGDVLQMSFPDAATGEPLGIIDAKDGFGRLTIYTSDEKKRVLASRCYVVAEDGETHFYDYPKIEYDIGNTDRAFLRGALRLKKEIELAFK